MLVETARPQTLTAPGKQSRSVLRAFFSFPMAMAALLVVITTCTVRGRLSDPDLWWHLKTGELIWRTHSIPHFDVFSFTVAGHPWTAQEWLSEVIIYGAYRVAGYSGLMAWLFVLAAAVVLGGYNLLPFIRGLDGYNALAAYRKLRVSAAVAPGRSVAVVNAKSEL